MNRACAGCAALALFVLAGPAWPQAAKPAPERPAASSDAGLNLKLDEPSGPRPRIQFGPASPAVGRGPGDAASTLPSLGEDKSNTTDFSKGGGSSRNMGIKNPIPKDTNPGL